jgi:PAS domain S-box-containing protein
MVATNLGLLQSHRWEDTPLGAMDRWPDEMRGVVLAALHSGFPILTAWGPDGLQVYNDAYNPILGAKHPASFGAGVSETWPEIMDFLGPALDHVRRTREPLWFKGVLLPLARSAAPEECYFDFSYSAVLSKHGEVLGVMSVAAERTLEAVAARRKPMEAWSFDHAAMQDPVGQVAQALQQKVRDNHMDACKVAVHRCDASGLLAAPAVWQLGGDGSATAVVQYPSPIPPELVRLPTSPGQHAPYAHLIPLKDASAQVIGVVTLVPNALVPEANHREFCAAVQERIHVALREAQARRTEFVLLQKDFSERERLYAFLFENMEDAAVYTAIGPGHEEVVLAANHKACLLSGYSHSELIGMRRQAVFPPDDPDVQAAVHARATSGGFLGELRLRRKDGSTLPVGVSSRIVEIQPGRFRSVSIVRDVSWWRAREKALADRARFEAMVELTGGIAHDFNNFLTAVLCSLDGLDERLPAQGAERSLIANAVLGAQGAASLASQLLTYAKRTSLDVAPLAWQPFLDEVEGLLACTVGDAVSVRIDVEPGLPDCMLDAAQLTSALLNLAVNARDAMPAGGTLALRARRCHRDQPHAGPDGHELPAGDYVELAVRDTGTGVPADILSRIFEPFFTTKGIDAGTGLGLAMVQGFVRQSGGDVRVVSSTALGTEFQILFPVGSPDAERADWSPRTPGGEIVLVVEGNDSVRHRAIAMLRGSGLLTLEAFDAQSALDQLRTNARVDALLADVALPAPVPGVELARMARERFPHLAVVLTSSAMPAALRDEAAAAGIGLLRKPFSARELVHTLLAEVDRRTAGPVKEPGAAA